MVAVVVVTYFVVGLFCALEVASDPWLEQESWTERFATYTVAFVLWPLLLLPRERR